MSLFQNRMSIEKSERLFTFKDLMKIAVPLIIQQVLTVTVGAIDTLMVAHAGEAAVSGVSLVNTLDTLLIYFFSSLVTGGAVVVSQTLGRKSYEEAREVAKQLLYATTIMASLVMLLSLIFRKPLLTLLFGDVEADVMFHAEWYFFFILFSFPLTAIESAIATIFRSAGNSLVSMIVSFCINLLNIGGNAILIIGLDMGAAGAAISTLVSRFVAATIMLVLIHNGKGVMYIEKMLRYKPDFKVIKRILHIGVPSGIENSMFQFGKLLTQSLISSMGTAVIAANAVALTVAQFQYMTGTAYSYTAVTVVGQCIGAGESKQAKHYSRVLLALNYLTLGFVILVTLLLINPILSMYDLSAASSEITRKLLIYHSLCAIVIWPIAFMLPSVFRAASDVRFPLLVSLFSMWIFRVALSYVLAPESISVFGWFTIPGLGMGVMGVWVAMTVDWVCRTVFFLVRYLSGRWMRVKQSP